MSKLSAYASGTVLALAALTVLTLPAVAQQNGTRDVESNTTTTWDLPLEVTAWSALPDQISAGQTPRCLRIIDGPAPDGRDEEQPAWSARTGGQGVAFGVVFGKEPLKHRVARIDHTTRLPSPGEAQTYRGLPEQRLRPASIRPCRPHH